MVHIIYSRVSGQYSHAIIPNRKYAPDLEINNRTMSFSVIRPKVTWKYCIILPKENPKIWILNVAYKGYKLLGQVHCCFLVSV